MDAAPAASDHTTAIAAFVAEVQREIMVDRPGDFFYDVFDTDTYAKYCDLLSADELTRGFWSVFAARQAS